MNMRNESAFWGIGENSFRFQTFLLQDSSGLGCGVMMAFFHFSSWFIFCSWVFGLLYFMLLTCTLSLMYTSCILQWHFSSFNIIFLLLIKKKKNMRNELQQQSKTKMSDTFKKPVNRNPTNELYLSIRRRVPHVQPFMKAYNLHIKNIKIVVKGHLVNDNNLQRSPTKFNYPSGFLWFTSQSS